jgi:hypothetical protein
MAFAKGRGDPALRASDRGRSLGPGGYQLRTRADLELAVGAPTGTNR